MSDTGLTLTNFRRAVPKESPQLLGDTEMVSMVLILP